MWPFGNKKKKEEKAKEVEAQKVQQPAKEEKAPKACAKKCDCKKEAPAAAPAKKQAKKDCGCHGEKNCGCTKPAPKKAPAKAAAKKAPAAKKEVAAEGVYRVQYDKASDSWKVTRDGAKRNLASAATKAEAMSRVKELTKGKTASVVVYNKDGKEQK